MVQFLKRLVKKRNEPVQEVQPVRKAFDAALVETQGSSSSDSSSEAGASGNKGVGGNGIPVVAAVESSSSSSSSATSDSSSSGPGGSSSSSSASSSSCYIENSPIDFPKSKAKKPVSQEEYSEMRKAMGLPPRIPTAQPSKSTATGGGKSVDKVRNQTPKGKLRSSSKVPGGKQKDVRDDDSNQSGVHDMTEVSREGAEVELNMSMNTANTAYSYDEVVVHSDQMGTELEITSTPFSDTASVATSRSVAATARSASSFTSSESFDEVLVHDNECELEMSIVPVSRHVIKAGRNNNHVVVRADTHATEMDLLENSVAGSASNLSSKAKKSGLKSECASVSGPLGMDESVNGVSVAGTISSKRSRPPPIKTAEISFDDVSVASSIGKSVQSNYAPVDAEKAITYPTESKGRINKDSSVDTVRATSSTVDMVEIAPSLSRNQGRIDENASIDTNRAASGVLAMPSVDKDSVKTENAAFSDTVANRSRPATTLPTKNLVNNRPIDFVRARSAGAAFSATKSGSVREVGAVTLSSSLSHWKSRRTSLLDSDNGVMSSGRESPLAGKAGPINSPDVGADSELVRSVSSRSRLTIGHSPTPAGSLLSGAATATTLGVEQDAGSVGNKTTMSDRSKTLSSTNNAIPEGVMTKEAPKSIDKTSEACDDSSSVATPLKARPSLSRGVYIDPEDPTKSQTFRLAGSAGIKPAASSMDSGGSRKARRQQLSRTPSGEKSMVDHLGGATLGPSSNSKDEQKHKTPGFVKTLRNLRTRLRKEGSVTSAHKESLRNSSKSFDSNGDSLSIQMSLSNSLLDQSSSPKCARDMDAVEDVEVGDILTKIRQRRETDLVKARGLMDRLKAVAEEDRLEESRSMEGVQNIEINMMHTAEDDEDNTADNEKEAREEESPEKKVVGAPFDETRADAKSVAASKPPTEAKSAKTETSDERKLIARLNDTLAVLEDRIKSLECGPASQTSSLKMQVDADGNHVGASMVDGPKSITEGRTDSITGKSINLISPEQRALASDHVSVMSTSVVSVDQTAIVQQSNPACFGFPSFFVGGTKEETGTEGKQEDFVKIIEELGEQVPPLTESDKLALAKLQVAESVADKSKKSRKSEKKNKKLLKAIKQMWAEKDTEMEAERRAMEEERQMMIKTMRQVRRKNRRKSRFMKELEMCWMQPTVVVADSCAQTVDNVCFCGRAFDSCVDGDCGLSGVFGEVPKGKTIRPKRSRQNACNPMGCVDLE